MARTKQTARLSSGRPISIPHGPWNTAAALSFRRGGQGRDTRTDARSRQRDQEWQARQTQAHSISPLPVYHNGSSSYRTALPIVKEEEEEEEEVQPAQVAGSSAADAMHATDTTRVKLEPVSPPMDVTMDAPAAHTTPRVNTQKATATGGRPVHLPASPASTTINTQSQVARILSVSKLPDTRLGYYYHDGTCRIAIPYWLWGTDGTWARLLGVPPPTVRGTRSVFPRIERLVVGLLGKYVSESPYEEYVPKSDRPVPENALPRADRLSLGELDALVLAKLQEHLERIEAVGDKLEEKLATIAALGMAKIPAHWRPGYYHEQAAICQWWTLHLGTFLAGDPLDGMRHNGVSSFFGRERHLDFPFANQTFPSLNATPYRPALDRIREKVPRASIKGRP